jgi:hypothetical protein
MKTWTAFTAAGQPPVLVEEGFSWGALVFGPFWLLAGRAWIAAALVLAVYIVLGALAPGWSLLVASVLMGLFGHDLRRMSLEHRGYGLAHVVAASNSDLALVRLLARRPDLVDAAVAAELRP